MLVASLVKVKIRGQRLKHPDLFFGGGIWSRIVMLHEGNGTLRIGLQAPQRIETCLRFTSEIWEMLLLRLLNGAALSMLGPVVQTFIRVQS